MRTDESKDKVRSEYKAWLKTQSSPMGRGLYLLSWADT